RPCVVAGPGEQRAENDREIREPRGERRRDGGDRQKARALSRNEERRYDEAGWNEGGENERQKREEFMARHSPNPSAGSRLRDAPTVCVDSRFGILEGARVATEPFVRWQGSRAQLVATLHATGAHLRIAAVREFSPRKTEHLRGTARAQVAAP